MEARKSLLDVDGDRINTMHFNYDIVNEHDNEGFHLFCWLDNVVKMVSILHDGTEKMRRSRRRPRQKNNKNHLLKIWNDKRVVDI